MYKLNRMIISININTKFVFKYLKKVKYMISPWTMGEDSFPTSKLESLEKNYV